MRVEIDVTGYRPNLSVSRDRKLFVIECELVNHLPEGPQQSGKCIHLGLTVDDAMRLLSLLQEAQRKLNLLAPQATMTVVPPAKDRN
jgi:hypothetical protein